MVNLMSVTSHTEFELPAVARHWRQNVFGAAALFAALILSAAAHAAPAQNVTVTDSRTTGSWTVRCYNIQQLPCDMTQASYVRGRNVRIASVAISYAPASNGYVGRFVVPLGVSFETGLGVKIGNFSTPHLRYRRCERDGCYVEGVLPQAMIDALQAGGSNGAMDVTLIDGRKFQVPIVLNGASDSLDLLKKWAGEKSQPKPEKK